MHVFCFFNFMVSAFNYDENNYQFALPLYCRNSYSTVDHHKINEERPRRELSMES